MTTAQTRVPPGPSEKYDTSQDLLNWLRDNFKRFGDVYKASVYGTSVYVVSDPRYADYVLRRNWQNYKKGQAIKRVGLLLGNGLMVSEGEIWKSQRRMIQPGIPRQSNRRADEAIATANLALLKKWTHAAKNTGALM